MRPSAKMAAAWFLAAGVGCAQSTLETLNPLGAQSHGLRLSNVSLFGGYTSVRMPEGSSLAGALPPGTNPVTGGELLLRWDHSGPRGGFSLSYTPSYSALPGHSEWNAANHALTFSLNRKLSGKWNLGLALNGEATSSNQMLFNPSVLSRVAGVEMTFEDLAGAMLSGTFTNNELAAILTGSPVLESSPAQALIYGSRALNTTATASLSYAYSTRMSFHVSGGVSRAQYLNDGQDPQSARNKALVPRTTSGNSNAGVSYLLSPRTTFGVETSANRSFSAYQDSYAMTGRLTLGRKMGQRWFLSGNGGVSTIIALRQTVPLNQGAQYVAGGSLGFRMRSQTLVATIDRMAADAYALGAAHTLSATGAWSWRRRGSGWSTSLSGGWQRLGGASAVSLEGWQISASLSRALSRQMSLGFTYGYMTNAGGLTGLSQDLTMQAARLSLIWQPGKGR